MESSDDWSFLQVHLWHSTARKITYPLFYLETFQAIQKLSGSSGKYPAYSETFQAIWKLSRLSRNFPDHPETIQPIWKLSRLSGNFPDNLENIQTIWKFSKWSGNFPVQFQGLRAKTFRTRKNFPDGNATLPPRFLGPCPPPS